MLFRSSQLLKIMQKDKILKKIIVLCFFIFYNFNSFGLAVPSLSGPVVDKAGILSRNEFNKIENFFLDLNNRSQIQIAVLIVPSYRSFPSHGT